MTTIRDIVGRLEHLNKKTILYQGLKLHLAMMIDCIDKNRVLPNGIEPEDALVVMHELDAILEAMDEERNAFHDLEIEDVEVPSSEAVLLGVMGT